MVKINERSASLVLLLLILADLVFIALHFVEALTPLLQGSLYSLERDGGYPEVYQYLKWFWIVVLLLYLAKSRKSFGYTAWVLVFTYFLLDDAMSIHEGVGRTIAGRLSVTPPFGLRLQDLGELAVSAIAGVVLSAVVAWAYLSESRSFRKASQDMLILLLALVFFGVLIDMLHMALQLDRDQQLVAGAVEDGGEMVVASIIFWYVFLLSVRADRTDAGIVAAIRAMLVRRAG
ncbi:MAG: hypothetical protein ACE5G3_07655 [Gammaproteobacteria bacterium]